MPTNIEKIDLIQIQAPELSDVNYGNNIKQQFDNIQTNFIKLANSGFTQGKQGESVKIHKEILTQDNIWYKGIYNAITSTYSSELLIPIDDKNWYDNIQNTELYVYTAVADDGDNELKSISIIPYILKDKRFDKIDYTKLPIYENIEDVSCILGFNGEYDGDIPRLEVINLYPTLYYDSNSGNFCWKIWGQYTGLSANGVPGAPGEDGDIIICIRGSMYQDNYYIIDKIASNNNAFDVNESNMLEYENKVAIILPGESGGDQYAGFWVGILKIENNKLICICDSYNNVLTKLTIDSNYFIENIMPNIPYYYLSLLDNNKFNIKSNGKQVIINNTINDEESPNDLAIKLNISLEPINQEKNSPYKLEVLNDGIYLTMNDKRYLLSTEDDTTLKLTLQT